MDEVCARKNLGLLLQKTSPIFQDAKKIWGNAWGQELTLEGKRWSLTGWQLHRVTMGEQCAGKQSCAVPAPECFSQLLTSHSQSSHLDYQLLIPVIELQSSRDLKSQFRT